MFWRRPRPSTAGSPSSSSGAASPCSPSVPSPAAPPPPLHYGVPARATCLCTHAVQGTVAVGCESGAVKLFGQGGCEVLLPAAHPSAVALLTFAEDRLLAVHRSSTLAVWSLRGWPSTVRVWKLPSAAVVTIASAVPASSIVLLGTGAGTVHACDVQSTTTSPWMLTAGDGAICALEPNPSAPERLLIGARRGGCEPGVRPRVSARCVG